jgi:hypothetical protein
MLNINKIITISSITNPLLGVNLLDITAQQAQTNYLSNSFTLKCGDKEPATSR